MRVYGLYIIYDDMRRRRRRIYFLIHRKGMTQRTFRESILPDIDLYRQKFAEKTSRLMSPFSKDETRLER